MFIIKPQYDTSGTRTPSIDDIGHDIFDVNAAGFTFIVRPGHRYIYTYSTVRDSLPEASVKKNNSKPFYRQHEKKRKGKDNEYFR